MKDTFTKTETTFFTLVVVAAIVAVITSISAWVNFLTGFDMVGSGVELVGEVIYQIKN